MGLFTRKISLIAWTYQDAIRRCHSGKRRGKGNQMGSVFKKYKTVDGNRIKLAKLYGKYKDEHGKTCERALSTDKQVARQLLAKLEREVERSKAGLSDKFTDAAKLPISVHLDAFKASLTAKNNGADHIAFTIAAIERIVAGCSIRRIPDISVERVANWLSNQRSTRDDFGNRASNRHVTAIKGFARWLWTTKRDNEHRLVGLTSLNTDIDPRHERRTLSPANFSKLLEATRNSSRVVKGKAWRLTGDDRYYLYLIAAYTGLRAMEIASLRRCDVSLGDSPTILVRASISKNKKTTTLSIHTEFAGVLKQWFEARNLHPGDYLFQNVKKIRWASVLKRDLVAAEIPYVDDQGRHFDFHSLRSQYITALLRAGVPTATVQQLARHSTPTLTARYNRLQILDCEVAVNSLPSMTKPLNDTKKSA